MCVLSEKESNKVRNVSPKLHRTEESRSQIGRESPGAGVVAPGIKLPLVKLTSHIKSRPVPAPPLASRFPADMRGRQWRLSAWALHTMGDLDGATVSWLQSGPTLAVLAIREMN